MTGKTHQVLGILAGGGVFFALNKEVAYNPATFFAVLFCSSFFALLPDLDRPVAKVWQTIPYGHQAGHVVDPFFKHRNFSHSIAGTFLFIYLAYFILQKFPFYWGIDINFVIISAGVAYASHLLADMFTVQGIPLLFPYRRMLGIPPKPFEGIRIETGKWFENLVLFPVLNIILIVIIVLKFDMIKSILFK